MNTAHAVLASTLLTIVVAGAALAQGAPALARHSPHVSPAPLPFAVGERLVYDGTAGPGLRGRGEMWIDGPEEVRGTSVIVLHFTFAAKVGFLKVADKTTSWLDPIRMSALRFVKEEHHLLARRSEDVSMEPLEHRWTATDGREGTTQSDAPLDELSFIYAIRTFSLGGDSTLVLDRHFDAARSPTTLRSLGRGTVTTPAGTFATREVEMRVRDSRNYKGEGSIRFSLSDDACRRPVRIQSTIPGAGTVVLTLRSALPVIAACAGTSAPGGEPLAAAR
ncbi:MAG: hypothetical protein JWN79_3223 [Gemmatimonadetes bacterium]|jgi:hypothetical protein|nr:hypothetical protein [Gemmatimonadota bacterium]